MPAPPSRSDSLPRAITIRPASSTAAGSTYRKQIMGQLVCPRVMGSAFRRPVDRDDSRAAEADVVLQSDLRAVHLTCVGLLAQLPAELAALREPGGAKRMTL